MKDSHDLSRSPHNRNSIYMCGQCRAECEHPNWRYVVGCMPEGGTVEGEECVACGYHTW